VRDWLHVDDHCAAIERILVDGKIGETYCIGGHCELSNFELVKRILSVMSEIAGKSYSMETHVAYVQDRPGTTAATPWIPPDGSAARVAAATHL